MKRARCNKCNSIVVKVTNKGLRKEYSFYCKCCEENLYKTEIHKNKI